MYVVIPGTSKTVSSMSRPPSQEVTDLGRVQPFVGLRHDVLDIKRAINLRVTALCANHDKAHEIDYKARDEAQAITEVTERRPEIPVVANALTKRL